MKLSTAVSFSVVTFLVKLKKKKKVVTSFRITIFLIIDKVMIAWK